MNHRRPRPPSAAARALALTAAVLMMALAAPPGLAGPRSAPRDHDFSATASPAPALADSARAEGNTGARSIFYGLATGVAGFGFGAVVGMMSQKDEAGELAGLEGFVIGGSIGGALALPLGVHAGNHGRGSLGAVMLTSVAVGGAGWAALYAFDEGAILPVTAMAQLVLCTVVEQATTPGSPSATAGVTAVAPCVIAGGGGVVVTGRF